MCLRVLKESNKSGFDRYSRQKQCIDHIPYYLSGLSRAHFSDNFSRNSCIPSRATQRESYETPQERFFSIPIGKDRQQKTDKETPVWGAFLWEEIEILGPLGRLYCRLGQEKTTKTKKKSRLWWQIRPTNCSPCKAQHHRRRRHVPGGHVASFSIPKPFARYNRPEPQF